MSSFCCRSSFTWFVILCLTVNYFHTGFAAIDNNVGPTEARSVANNFNSNFDDQKLSKPTITDGDSVEIDNTPLELHLDEGKSEKLISQTPTDLPQELPDVNIDKPLSDDKQNSQIESKNKKSSVEVQLSVKDPPQLADVDQLLENDDNDKLNSQIANENKKSSVEVQPSVKDPPQLADVDQLLENDDNKLNSQIANENKKSSVEKQTTDEDPPQLEDVDQLLENDDNKLNSQIANENKKSSVEKQSTDKDPPQLEDVDQLLDTDDNSNALTSVKEQPTEKDPPLLADVDQFSDNDDQDQSNSQTVAENEIIKSTEAQPQLNDIKDELTDDKDDNFNSETVTDNGILKPLDTEQHQIPGVDYDAAEDKPDSNISDENKFVPNSTGKDKTYPYQRSQFSQENLNHNENVPPSNSNSVHKSYDQPSKAAAPADSQEEDEEADENQDSDLDQVPVNGGRTQPVTDNNNPLYDDTGDDSDDELTRNLDEDEKKLNQHEDTVEDEDLNYDFKGHNKEEEDEEIREESDKLWSEDKSNEKDAEKEETESDDFNEDEAITNTNLNVDQASTKKGPTAPSGMVLVYTWIIVAILIAVVGISTYQARFKAFILPYFKKSSPCHGEDKKRLLDHEFV